VSLVQKKQAGYPALHGTKGNDRARTYALVCQFPHAGGRATTGGRRDSRRFRPRAHATPMSSNVQRASSIEMPHANNGPDLGATPVRAVALPRDALASTLFDPPPRATSCVVPNVTRHPAHAPSCKGGTGGGLSHRRPARLAPAQACRLAPHTTRRISPLAPARSLRLAATSRSRAPEQPPSPPTPFPLMGMLTVLWDRILVES